MLLPNALSSLWEKTTAEFSSLLSLLMEDFCRPKEEGKWATQLPSGFGAYTPCLVDSFVVTVSNLLLLFVTLYRIYYVVASSSPPSSSSAYHSNKKFKLKNPPLGHLFAILLVACCIIGPLLQLVLGISNVNLDGELSLPPYELLTFLVSVATWLSVLAMLCVEMKTYTKDLIWYVRFVLVYVVVAQTAILRYLLALKDYSTEVAMRVVFGEYLCAVLFCVFYTFYFPALEPQTDFTPILVHDEQYYGSEYEPLAGEQEVCPEHNTSFISFLLFEWMTPLMKSGYKKPIDDQDVWLLDKWDTTEQVYSTFQHYWYEERAQLNPSLLRALNRSLGARFWLGGIYKVGNDAAQFVGPVCLSLVLVSMQNQEPVWKGYVYAALIFAGVMFGVLCEAQYFQNVIRVGFRTRSALTAAIFRKSLRLSQAGRRGFTMGKITNLITSDTDAVQQTCQQLHSLWSAPLRIIIAIVLLYQQLGLASILGSIMLLLLFPVQAFIISWMKNLQKQGLQRTDKRIDLISEILSAMDIVKYFGWEESFKTKVLGIRADEISWFRKSQLLNAVNSFLLDAAPVLVAVLAFGLYTYFGGELTPAKTFTSLSLFAVLRFPLYTLPTLIVSIVNANVSLKRLQEFLVADERDLQPNPALEYGLPAISIENRTFSWDPTLEWPTLSNINLHVEVGSLVAIVGSTGAGKSSIISAILGDLPAVSGRPAIVRGKVAYVPQVSWIFNASVQDNILLGSPYEPERYKMAIDASALAQDLASLPNGDLTEIGERGVNISGGQKQRVSIARAIYSNADVYLLDDPLSALDAHVAKQVFETCLLEKLRGKTRVLVTNQLHFLSQVDRIILVNEGEIKEQGAFDELLANGPLFKQLMENVRSMEENMDDDGDKMIEAGDEVNVIQMNGAKSEEAFLLEHRVSSKKDMEDMEKKKKDVKAILIKEEERETGVMSWKVLSRYIEAMGGTWVAVVLFFFYVMVEVARLSTSGWLAIWTDETRPKMHGPFFYLQVYMLLSFVQVFFNFGNSFGLVLSSLVAAGKLHNRMLESVLRAPISFFHVNPLGRILNRFAKDTGEIDRTLAWYVNGLLAAGFELLSTFVLIGFVNTIALWAILPLLLAFNMAYLYFQSTVREVKRLDAITRSPVYAQFSETLNGAASIRAYNLYDRMAIKSGRAVDANIHYMVVNTSSNRWLSIRLEFLGGLMIWITATLAVFGNARASDQAAFAPQMGLLLSYTLNITFLMMLTLRLASLAENSFNAVERVGNYIDTPSEAPLVIEGYRPPPAWPTDGAIEFQNVVMRYRPDLPPVIHGLSVKIHPMGKIGVVGRTGAGKSSMINTLFRMVEAESGHILIDGLSIRKMGLSDLRKNLGIIPQSPVLFSGSMRFNLDPFGKHTDADLWESLERAHLTDVFHRNGIGLDSEVSEGGENFSVGQRQLLNLARALIRRPKILVLDEATASVDYATDALIQKTIRKEFKSCTMITIAHRLNTIIDTDRILVLDAGMLIEFNTPQQLLSNADSMFSGMVQSTGAANARHLHRIVMGGTNMESEIEEVNQSQYFANGH